MAEAEPQRIQDLIDMLAPGSNCALIDVQSELQQIGSAAVPALIAALHHESVHIASNAAQTLGKIGDPAAVDALLEALSDFEWALRKQAVRALGHIQDPRALPFLEAMSRYDETAAVRRAAAQALRQIRKQ